jgi:DNA processing protein
MGPRRFQAMLAGAEPSTVWQRLRSGTYRPTPAVAETLEPEAALLLVRWRKILGKLDVAETWRDHRRAGIRVLGRDDPDHPRAFRDDPDPPVVLFAAGDLGLLDGPAVAIVGTRRCTQYGRDVASEMGAHLAAAGVHVVSGLALGIDAAAHAGALSVDGAPPIGVVGNGLDVTYPRRNAALYRAVRERGLLLSEYPLGAQPRRWTFPARNRLVAALARAVVVVETPEAGGSQHTIDEADRRDVEVLAVPGSVRSPASAGTNKLLWEGRPAVRDALDVLDALGLPSSPAPAAAAVPVAVPASEPATPPVELVGLLDAVGWEPATLEEVLLRAGLGLPDLHAGLSRLEDLGWIRWEGNWIERRAAGGVR